MSSIQANAIAADAEKAVQDLGAVAAFAIVNASGVLLVRRVVGVADQDTAIKRARLAAAYSFPSTAAFDRAGEGFPIIHDGVVVGGFGLAGDDPAKLAEVARRTLSSL